MCFLLALLKLKENWAMASCETTLGYSKKKEFALLFFLMVQTTDFFITTWAVVFQGVHYEVNPIARFVMEITNPLYAILIFKFVALVGGWFLYRLNYWRVLYFMIFFYVTGLLIGIFGDIYVPNPELRGEEQAVKTTAFCFSK